ncbi:hypothetical protein RM550_30075 [Streptomyces sp. DSM 41527]|uniref:Uncharacterized protein n=1 Tax=Streptomyces mooreae TaxID=3075523 RepID=A0ABU2TG48_9ACTN|nr:hypothetical protein [Streptomyces sp. DSM 41527]MDT0459922.1 hypothetical protein [Streptomyces sp. DSM 41527]
MTGNNMYGSRADLLPRFIADSLRKSNQIIRVLSADENSAAVNISLNRFSHASAGVINWDGTPGAEMTSFADEPAGKEVLKNTLTRIFNQESSATLFWGTMVLPSVTLPVNLAEIHSDELVERDVDFWLFCPESEQLIEFRQDGYVTSAPIPSAPMD